MTNIQSFRAFIVLVALSFANLLATNASEFSRDSLDKLMTGGLYSEAETYFLTSKTSAFELNDSTKIEWLIEYSSIAASAAHSDLAFENIQRAIQLAEETESVYLISKSKIQLIELYRNVRFYDKALKVIKEMESLLPKIADRQLARYYHRSAAVYNELQYLNQDNSYLDTAISLSNLSIEISLKNNYNSYLATSYNELGNIYERLEEWEEALKYYDKSIELWKNKSLFDYANAIKNKGSYFLNRKEFDSSIFYLSQGLSMAAAVNNYRFNMETLWGLKQAYYLKGDSLNGLKFELREAQNDINDFKRKLNDKLLDLTIAYESKEKDDLLYNNKLTLQKEKERLRIIGIIAFALLLILVVISSFFIYSRRKNVQLSKLLEENSFLIGESNHRIKNNLQLIVSLIGRELYKSKKTNPELQEISDKIKTIAVLHQHLYVNDSKESISIPVYLKSIEKNMKSALMEDEINLLLQVDEFELPIEKSVYLGLLITELITNSLKHAFSTTDSKNINITVQKDDNNVLFHYKDNGAGLAKGELPHLVDILTRQLKSEVHIVSDLGYQLKLVFNA